MTPELDAKQMQNMTKEILTVIEGCPGHDRIEVILGSLGAVLGCFAEASGQRERAIEAVTRVAQGVVVGELLE